MQRPSTPEIARDFWPSLRVADWEDTRATLHMWTQIVGKVRLELAPYANHWWQVPLYVSVRGLTTSPIPYGPRSFEIEFDFIEHSLLIKTSDGQTRQMALEPRSVADFYRELIATLDAMGLPVRIWPVPCEVPDPIRFDKDAVHASYDREAANRFWQVLVQVDRIFKEFRGGFIGKCSPVHFFWGSFDLAVTRFSGCRAPDHPGIPGMPISMLREAYSHEVSSLGFWPGSGGVDAAFYSYAYPEPAGYRAFAVRPAEASFNEAMGEFLLAYEGARTSADPDKAILDFAQSTYEAAAICGKWDRAALER
ncbi:MAG TPA: DUF5996 family protein [Capsulimonadaceae bacterium]|nr:DUF5996 family protein [Capsulimonadaceae bacterium]